MSLQILLLTHYMTVSLGCAESANDGVIEYLFCLVVEKEHLTSFLLLSSIWRAIGLVDVRLPFLVLLF